MKLVSAFGTDRVGGCRGTFQKVRRRSKALKNFPRRGSVQLQGTVRNRAELLPRIVFRHRAEDLTVFRTRARCP